MKLILSFAASLVMTLAAVGLSAQNRHHSAQGNHETSGKCNCCCMGHHHQAASDTIVRGCKDRERMGCHRQQGAVTPTATHCKGGKCMMCSRKQDAATPTATQCKGHKEGKCMMCSRKQDAATHCKGGKCMGGHHRQASGRQTSMIYLSPEGSVESNTEQMIPILNLSDEQYDRIVAIAHEQIAQASSLGLGSHHRIANLSGEQQAALAGRLDEIRSEYDTKLKDILSREQWAKYREVVAAAQNGRP